MRWFILALVASSLATGPATADWPGFRGQGDGVAKETSLPTKWTETENLAWTVDLPGYGQSAPCVWKGTVYLTAVEGANREKGFIVALDAATGKEKWRHTFEPTQKAAWGYTISRAAPTPVADDAGVYALFEGGNLIALTPAGKLRWERDLVKEFGEIKGGHGLGSSPCQTADTVFVLIDHPGPSYLLAVDKSNGKDRWKTEREKRTSWASPVVAVRDGKPEIVASSGGSVAGYDPAKGELLWELKGLSGNTLPSASVLGDTILVGAGAGRGMAADAKPGMKSNCCLKLTAADGKPSYKLAWSADTATASYATPIAHGGQAYFVNATGLLFCLDLATGKEQYAERLPALCWASPIAHGENVYFFCKNGQTVVVKAGAEYEVVATNRLWDPKADAPKPAPAATEKSDRGPGPSGEFMDPIVYGVAAADGSFFVRTGSKLYRVGKP